MLVSSFVLLTPSARSGNMVTRFAPFLLSITFYAYVPLLALGQTDLSSCYFADGTLSNTTFPCNSGGASSTCCPSDTACLENQLCLTDDGEVLRGTCSDSSWSDSACPNFCLTGDSSFTALASILSRGPLLTRLLRRRRPVRRSSRCHCLLEA